MVIDQRPIYSSIKAKSNIAQRVQIMQITINGVNL